MQSPKNYISCPPPNNTWGYWRMYPIQTQKEEDLGSGKQELQFKREWKAFPAIPRWKLYNKLLYLYNSPGDSVDSLFHIAHPGSSQTPTGPSHSSCTGHVYTRCLTTSPSQHRHYTHDRLHSQSQWQRVILDILSQVPSWRKDCLSCSKFQTTSCWHQVRRPLPLWGQPPLRSLYFTPRPRGPPPAFTGPLATQLIQPASHTPSYPSSAHVVSHPSLNDSSIRQSIRPAIHLSTCMFWTCQISFQIHKEPYYEPLSRERLCKWGRNSTSGAGNQFLSLGPGELGHTARHHTKSSWGLHTQNLGHWSPDPAEAALSCQYINWAGSLFLVARTKRNLRKTQLQVAGGRFTTWANLSTGWSPTAAKYVDLGSHAPES